MSDPCDPMPDSSKLDIYQDTCQRAKVIELVLQTATSIMNLNLTGRYTLFAVCQKPRKRPTNENIIKAPAFVQFYSILSLQPMDSRFISYCILHKYRS